MRWGLVADGVLRFDTSGCKEVEEFAVVPNCQVIDSGCAQFCEV